MAPTTYNFDPDGDLVLVLSKTRKTTSATSQKSANRAADPPSIKRKRGSSTQSVQVSEPEKISMIVSSKHLMLASPVFKAMLQPGRFREGIQRNAAGQMEVDLPDDDQPIMVIVLNIIHGRNRLVPKQVDLKMLTKLAILVDKYQMVEAVESFSDPWLDDLLTKAPLPKSYLNSDEQKTIHRWLAVSWVFRLRNEFYKITSAAIIGCGANLADKIDAELPIPKKVIESIVRNREINMSKILEVVERIIKKYQGKKVNCSCPDHGFACDAMVLGYLIKSMVKQKVWPIPKSPYEHFTLNDFKNIFGMLEIETLCSQMPACRQRSSSKDHGVRESIANEVRIAGRTTGLDITHIKNFK